jgi:aminopeptidase N
MDAAASQALSSLDLDFRGMAVDSVEVNGGPATFERLGRELKVIPERPLKRGRPFTILVNYHGEPAPSASQFVPWGAGWLQAEDGSVNVMDYPDGAETWFPVNDHQRDKATYDLGITVPSGWYVVGPGTLAASVEDEGSTRFVYTMGQPMASTSAGFHIDKYEIVALSQPGDVEAKLYVPEDADQDLKQKFDVVPDELEFLSGIFGPYPFRSYSIVLADPWLSICLDYGLANSEQTVTLQCPTYYATNELTTVHELAHQWFGSSVSLVTLQDSWLLEGPATYAMWMWLSRQGDLDALDRLVRPKAAVYSPRFRLASPLRI